MKNFWQCREVKKWPRVKGEIALRVLCRIRVTPVLDSTCFQSKWKPPFSLGHSKERDLVLRSCLLAEAPPIPLFAVSARSQRCPRTWLPWTQNLSAGPATEVYQKTDAIRGKFLSWWTEKKSTLAPSTMNWRRLVFTTTSQSSTRAAQPKPTIPTARRNW